MQIMLKQSLILQIMKYKNHYLKEKIKSNWSNEKLIRWEKIIDFAALRPKKLDLIDDNDKNKKSQRHRKMCHKAKT